MTYMLYKINWKTTWLILHVLYDFPIFTCTVHFSFILFLLHFLYQFCVCILYRWHLFRNAHHMVIAPSHSERGKQKVKENLSLSPIRERKSDNYRYCDSWKSNKHRKRDKGISKEYHERWFSKAHRVYLIFTKEILE